MSSFYYFVLSTLALVTISTILFAVYYKNRLINMAGMILSMLNGMNVGLIAGILLGSQFQGNLYQSTILAMLSGIIAGSTCGIVFGIIPLVEGFMSGLMGGMMGAMLGNMVTVDESTTLINVLLTISVSSLLLYKILQSEATMETYSNNKKWLYKPLLTFVLLSAYLLFGANLDKHTTEHRGHMNHIIQKSTQ